MKIKILATVGFGLFSLSGFSQTPTAPGLSPQLQQQIQQLMQQQAAGTLPGANKAEDPTHAKVKGIPRLIRDSPVPQVFFSDINDTYYLPTSDDYNRIMNALTIGLQKKAAVSMVVNKKTGLILDIDTGKLPASTGGGPGYDSVPDDDTSSAGSHTASPRAQQAPSATAGTPSYVPAGGVMPSGIFGNGGGSAPAPAVHQSGWAQ
jgi:hypothetical protein